MRSIKIFIAESCVPHTKIFATSKQSNDLVLDTSQHRLSLLMALGLMFNKSSPWLHEDLHILPKNSTSFSFCKESENAD